MIFLSTWSLLILKPVSLDFSGAYINEFVVLLLKLVGNGFLDLSQRVLVIPFTDIPRGSETM